jgi:hypothetical protein
MPALARCSAAACIKGNITMIQTMNTAMNFFDSDITGMLHLK